ncbi:MAG: hypothetical protein R3F39_24265 [Myxococcota bacterium]
MSAAPTPDSLDATSAFHTRALAPAVTIAVLSLAAALVYGLCGDALLGPRSAGADAYSRSLVGHHALVAFLNQTGLLTTVRRSPHLGELGPGTVLLVAEPHLDGPAAQDDADNALVDALDVGADVIWVLPKWSSSEDPANPGYVDSLTLRPVADALDSLNYVLTLTSEVVAEGVLQPDAPPTGPWTTPWGAFDIALPMPQLLAPDLPDLTPVVSCPDGVLVARHPSGAWVIADPDLINNAGLQRADNALVTHHLLLDGARASLVVVDEVVHGYARPDSLWVELATFPLAVVTLHALCLILLFVWAGLARFGEPEPLPPRVAPGKAALIEVGAGLLTSGADLRETLTRYLAIANAAAAHALGLSPDLAPAARDARLAEIARHRGLRDDPAALALAIDALPRRGLAAALALARRIHHLRGALAAPSTSHTPTAPHPPEPPWTSPASPTSPNA